MNNLLFKSAFLSSLTAIVFLVGCRESTVTQCQKIINITKKIEKESQNNLQTEDPKKLLKVADAFENSAKELEQLTISEEKLVPLKDGLAEVYRGYAEGTREIVAIASKKDVYKPLKAELSLKKVQINGEKQRQLIDQMNQYCQQ